MVSLFLNQSLGTIFPNIWKRHAVPNHQPEYGTFRGTYISAIPHQPGLGDPVGSRFLQEYGIVWDLLTPSHAIMAIEQWEKS